MAVEVEIIFQHGWASDADFWRPLCYLLPKTIASYRNNRGYFKSSRTYNFQSQQTVHGIITHSFGLHLISQEQLLNCDWLVIISGFLNFHPEPISYQKRSQQRLQQMLSQIKNHQTQIVLEKFYQRCSSYAQDFLKIPVVKNHQLFYDDLSNLNQADLNADLIFQIPKILVLHGEIDAIVPAEKARQFKEKFLHTTMKIFPNLGHDLPFSNPELCWKEISSFIR